VSDRPDVMTLPLMRDCDPFWINAQRETKKLVKVYVRRNGLSHMEHRTLLDILGLS
jgi:hypothetical protein